MKSILSTIAFMTVILTATYAQPQSLQATLKPGTAANSLFVALKPTLALSGFFSQEIYTFQIPTSVPTPSVTVKSNPLRGYTDSVATFLFAASETASPGYKTIVLIISSVGKPAYPFVVGTEFNAKEFTFGSGISPAQMAQIRLGDLPGGGATSQGNLYLEVSGAEVEKSSALFYGVGATNASGGYSYLPQSVLLPIKFTDFTAVKRNNDGLISWSITNQDRTTHHYEIERSLNGTDFLSIVTIPADLSQGTTGTYKFTDPNITNLKTSGYIYYRIKEVDVDGRFVYTDIRSIRLDTKPISISLYPNPASDFTTLILELQEAGTVALNITDAAGKLVQQSTFAAFKGTNHKKINLSSFSSGTYMIKVNTGEISQTISLVKTK